MTRTLQFYVGRELLKTFALTAIGLVLTFTLCGSVFNMIEAELLTAVEMIRILAFVLPLAATLMLPVSALFACAIVYGRFSADNEFDACRASGINIHRLLLPAIWLSIATAGFTFALSNYVIPHSAAGLEAVVRQDLQKLFIQALKARGYVRYRGFVLYAAQPELVNNPDTGAPMIEIRNAAFMRLEGEGEREDDLVACGTADTVHVEFWGDAETGNPRIGASMYDVWAMDIKRDTVVTGHQRIESVEIPLEIEQKPKFLDLSQLISYRRDPTLFPSMRKETVAIRHLVRDALFYQYVEQQLHGPDKVLKLEDPRHRYEIRAQRAALSGEGLLPRLEGVTVKHWWDDRYREYQAERCSIEVSRGFGKTGEMAHLTLRGDVTFTDSLDSNGQAVHLRKHDLDEVALPARPLEPERQMTDADLIGYTEIQDKQIREPDRLEETLKDLNLGPRVHKGRIDALKELIKLELKITGVIHSRLAFSASSLVMLILAAALGIIFRGGQLLTAFVISFVPGLIVVVITIAGQRMTENAGTHLMGIAVIWAGIALLAVADGVVLSRYLKR